MQNLMFVVGIAFSIFIAFYLKNKLQQSLMKAVTAAFALSILWLFVSSPVMQLILLPLARVVDFLSLITEPFHLYLDDMISVTTIVGTVLFVGLLSLFVQPKRKLFSVKWVVLIVVATLVTSVAIQPVFDFQIYDIGNLTHGAYPHVIIISLVWQALMFLQIRSELKS